MVMVVLVIVFVGIIWIEVGLITLDPLQQALVAQLLNSLESAGSNRFEIRLVSARQVLGKLFHGP
jgi:hypothetical protein